MHYVRNRVRYESDTSTMHSAVLSATLQIFGWSFYVCRGLSLAGIIFDKWCNFWVMFSEFFQRNSLSSYGIQYLIVAIRIIKQNVCQKITHKLQQLPKLAQKMAEHFLRFKKYVALYLQVFYLRTGN